jgi:hypothetical protein
MSEEKPTILTPEIMRALDEIAKRDGSSKGKVLEALVTKAAAKETKATIDPDLLKLLGEQSQKTMDPVMGAILQKLMVKDSIDMTQMILFMMMNNQSRPPQESTFDKIIMLQALKGLTSDGTGNLKDILAALNSSPSSSQQLVAEQAKQVANVQTKMIEMQQASTDKLNEAHEKSTDRLLAVMQGKSEETSGAADKELEYFKTLVNNFSSGKVPGQDIAAKMQESVNQAIISVVDEKIKKGLIAPEQTYNPETGQINQKYVVDKLVEMGTNVIGIVQKAIEQQGRVPPAMKPTPQMQLPTASGLASPAQTPAPQTSPQAAQGWLSSPSIPDQEIGSSSGYGPSSFLDPGLQRYKAAAEAAKQGAVAQVLQQAAPPQAPEAPPSVSTSSRRILQQTQDGVSEGEVRAEPT